VAGLVSVKVRLFQEPNYYVHVLYYKFGLKAARE